MLRECRRMVFLTYNIPFYPVLSLPHVLYLPRFIPFSVSTILRFIPFSVFYPRFRVLSPFPCFIPYSVPQYRNSDSFFYRYLIAIPPITRTTPITRLICILRWLNTVPNNSGVQQLPPLIKLRIFGFCGADIGMFNIFLILIFVFQIRLVLVTHSSGCYDKTCVRNSL
jgi:hypothetical protein